MTKEKERQETTTKKFPAEIFFPVTMVFLEISFHLARMGLTFDNLGYKILFALFYGALFSLITGLLPKKASQIATFIITGLITIYFEVQIIFSGVFYTYFSPTGFLGVTGQALDFTDVIFLELLNNWLIVLVTLIPFILLFFLRKHMDFEPRKMFIKLIHVLACLTIFLTALISMTVTQSEAYSAMEIYRKYTSVDMAVTKLGVTESLWLDIRTKIGESLGISADDEEFLAENSVEALAPGNTPSDSSNQTEGSDSQAQNDSTSNEGNDSQVPSDDTQSSEEPEIDTSPNILDLDFEKLIAEETDKNIQNLHKYVSSVTPTNKNEYTGMFEGYNLIFIVAEGFSGYVLDPELTPTLYKLSHEGFVFNNYYSPLWFGSTLGGEYADLTGLMPKNGGYLSMKKTGENQNNMLFTLSQQLLKLDYTVNGYHNNSYTYYGRNLSHTNLGYNWHGSGNGYEPEYYEDGNALWPQSDLYMIQQTFDQYCDQEPFHTYYMTVSGHVVYSNVGNAMCARHKDYVADLDYSDTTKCYIACQYELELALTELVARLEESGLADRTLLVLAADHIPYNDKDVLDELAGYELDSTFEWYKNSLIIWSGSMEEPVIVDKYCSSLDILPTVSNLMGLEYDSRMLAGQDILSDSEALVMFNDRSFITDSCFYDANTKEVTPINGATVDDAYIKDKISQVSNKFRMAEKICDYDYYDYIDKALQED